MAGLCKVQIIGNLGRDPEMRFTQSGKPMTRFSVAVNRMYTASDGDRKEETEWFTVIAWSRLAEISSEILSKGKRVYVEGRLQTRVWDGADGQKQKSLEIIASEILSLEPRRPAPSDEEPHERVDDLEVDEIPF